MKCFDCPRMCGTDRALRTGACGEGEKMRISRISRHMYEEPPICGKGGSGTVFFCGCSLGCVFCQNKDISRGGSVGREYTPRELADEIFRLEEQGVCNINFVTPTHFSSELVKTLELVKPRLSIPVVYNTSGYERVETLCRLDGLVDIYLPDFKYASAEVARKYSHAEHYPTVAETALVQMYSQVGKYKYAEDGTLASGMIVRHLVLPSNRHDSIAVLDRLAEILPADGILLSLMSQYTPEFATDCEYSELHRRLTKFEYTSVLKVAQELGFEGFMQDFSSASREYTPEFITKISK